MSTIKAYAVIKANNPIEIFSYDRDLGPNDIRIAIHYCGLSIGDIQILDNKWGATKYPAIAGHETIGNVIEVGEGVTNFSVGDLVGIGYQLSACFGCEYCKAGHEQYCELQKNIELGEYGGFADSIVVDNRFAFKLPQMFDAPEYVPLMCAGLTVFSAIKKVKMENTSQVGVLGLGGLGHLAIQFLAKMGHRVTVFSHTLEKQNDAIALGAKSFIYIGDKKIEKSLHRFFDSIIVTSNTSLDTEQYLGLLKPSGTLSLVGLPLDNLSFNATSLADYAGKQIQGSYIGSRAEMQEMLDFAEKYDIKGITEVMEMQFIREAIEKVKDSKVRYRMVLKNSLAL